MPLKLTAYLLTKEPQYLLRSVIGHVAAGAPIDIVGEEEEMDLNYILSKGSRDNMVIRVEGDSMCPEIESGDWVVVAFDIEPKPGDIIIGKINGGYTIKRLKKNDLRGKQGLFLVPSNGSVPTREVTSLDEFQVIGVVLGKAQTFRRQ